MGDVGEYWRDYRDWKRQARASMRAQIPTLLNHLRKAGHRVELVDINSRHYRINGTVNYWPGTGRWTTVATWANRPVARGKGYSRLVRYLEEKSQ